MTKYCSFRKRLLAWDGIIALLFTLLSAFDAGGQSYLQTIKGVFRDLETGQPVSAIDLRISNQKVSFQTTTDSLGNFHLKIPVGRWTIAASRLGYKSKVIQNVQVGSGKEVVVEIGLESVAFQTSEIRITAGNSSWLLPAGGSSVKVLQSQDASRFAGGYYDPLRMVANFAGVTSGNSDESNEIIVRGNSPRGLLWRLEGMEIPNPNHLANGVGNNGGAYSMISTNVLSDFDFFTGAFPAEFGNALSGVMDLRLRSGNAGRREYGIQLSAVGVECSAEGPLLKSGNSTFLANFRYANFNFLKDYGVLPVANLSIIPSSLDWTMKMNFHTKKSGDFEFFSIGGISRAGDEPLYDKAKVKSGINNDEFLQDGSLSVVGLKHTIYFKNQKTYARSFLGFTQLNEDWHEGVIDTNFVHIQNKKDYFIFPSLRGGTMINSKLNAKNSIRAGLEFHRTSANMLSIRRLSTGANDTLLDQESATYYARAYFQWKIKPTENFEIVPSVHAFYTHINRELSFEPRLGLILSLPSNQSINVGTGLYSKLEPLPVYYFRVKTSKTERKITNNDLKTTKAFHLVAGYRKQFSVDWKFSMEGYYQHLYDVPVAESTTSTYSILNISDGLPDVNLTNKGLAKNIGLELTLDKSFTHNYYLLAALSLFDSEYKAPNSQWYSSYYNSNTIFNLLVGKEFKIGKDKQNVLGFNLRSMARGGYRYTPPDYAQSLKKKYLVYDISQTYGKHLPFFSRVDAGINYRINRRVSSINISIDIQNVLSHKNVYRKSFSYSNGVVTESERVLIGLVPIAGIRFDF